MVEGSMYSSFVESALRLFVSVIRSRYYTFLVSWNFYAPDRRRWLVLEVLLILLDQRE